MIPRRRDGAARTTPFERWGGQPFFDALVARFYEGVVEDPLLRPLYPDDLTSSMRHLSLFLAQFWGGPETYNEERGHPRLRLRHAPFPIGPAESEAWLRHMTAAVDASGLPDGDARDLLDYLAGAARSLVNAPG
jgi:hemoglobin